MNNLYNKLEAATIVPISIEHKFDFGEFQYSMLYADGSYKLIVIIPGDMIFVTATTRDGLDVLIENDEFDKYEAYDLTDGCAYYLNSPSALDITEALLAMVSTCGQQCPMMSTETSKDVPVVPNDQQRRLDAWAFRFIAAGKDEPKSATMKRAIRCYQRGIITRDECKSVFDELKRR